jgi:4-hydroxy-tetrahydrodipicolinate synthase
LTGLAARSLTQSLSGHPTSRVYDRDIATLRRGLQLAGLTPTADPDEAFYAGRFP